MPREKIGSGFRFSPRTDRLTLDLSAAAAAFDSFVREPIMEAYDRLVKLVQDAEEDIRKAEGGNKAAGTRVRKTMQEIKKICQDVRVAVLELRGDE